MSFGVPGAFGSSCRAVERPRRAFTVAQFVKDDLTSRHAPAMFGSSRPDPLNSQIRRLVDCSGVSFIATLRSCPSPTLSMSAIPRRSASSNACRRCAPKTSANLETLERL